MINVSGINLNGVVIKQISTSTDEKQTSLMSSGYFKNMTFEMMHNFCVEHDIWVIENNKDVIYDVVLNISSGVLTVFTTKPKLYIPSAYLVNGELKKFDISSIVLTSSQPTQISQKLDVSVTAASDDDFIEYNFNYLSENKITKGSLKMVDWYMADSTAAPVKVYKKIKFSDRYFALSNYGDFSAYTSTSTFYFKSNSIPTVPTGMTPENYIIQLLNLNSSNCPNIVIE